MSWLYLVVEEADLEDVLHVGYTVSHAEVPQWVAQQDDVTVFLQLFEVLCVPQGAIMFVVHMDQLTFESPQDPLQDKKNKKQGEPVYFCCHETEP